MFFNLHAADASKHNTSFSTKTGNVFIYRDKGKKNHAREDRPAFQQMFTSGAQEHV